MIKMLLLRRDHVGQDVVMVNSVLQGVFGSRTKSSGQESDAQVPSVCDHRGRYKAVV